MTLRRREVVALVAGVLVTAGAVVVTLLSDHEPHRILSAILGPLIGVSFVASGLVAWSRRPDNRFGPLLIGVGFTWALAALAEANDPALFTVGVLLGAVAFVAFAHAVLAFPSGYLDSTTARIAVAVGYVDVTILQAVEMLFDDSPGSSSHDPRNVLLVADHAQVAKAIGYAQEGLGAAVALTAFTVLALRYWRASPPQRRALTPVVAGGGAFAILIALQLIVQNFDDTAGNLIHWLVMGALASAPIALLLGFLRGRLARVAVSSLVLELRSAPGPEQLQDALRRAVRDPSLELAFWLPGSRAFVDVAGHPIELPTDDATRAATMVEHEGRRVGALVHDRSVAADRALVESVAAAAALALENARLQAEVRARLDELERERDFSNAIVRTAPGLLIVLERDGRIVEFNEACERLTGYSYAEVIGRSLWEIFIDEDERPGIERAFAELDATGLPSRNENHWRTRDGERRLIVWTNAALPDEDGRVQYVVSGGLDVTDYRRQQAELKASRQRIVEAGLAERRRLERNLHDGAQQRLVSLSLALRLARARVREQPAEAERLLDGASDELAQALEELRELARGIHPAVLTDRGLDAALEALAARIPLPVDVEAALEERLPPAVEAAAYYVVAEGLTNVVKYAQASAARVSVWRRNGSAVVEVADDGVGGADEAGGSGLAGLRDRIEALDGRLEIESEPGEGTLVRAEIPCA